MRRAPTGARRSERAGVRPRPRRERGGRAAGRRRHPSTVGFEFIIMDNASHAAQTRRGTAMNPSNAPHATLDEWQRAAARSAPGGDLSALNWITPEGLTVKPLYTAADLEGLAH